jgi:hypothetical protein
LSCTYDVVVDVRIVVTVAAETDKKIAQVVVARVVGIEGNENEWGEH